MNQGPETLALRAAALLAVDPVGLGGATLRGPAGPAREAWMAGFRDMLEQILGRVPSPAIAGEGGLGVSGCRMRASPDEPSSLSSDDLDRPHPIFSDEKATFFREREKERASRCAYAGGEKRPWRRLPPGIGESRLLGGLDLTATLSAGRPIAERGLLVETDGGVLVVPMAERLPDNIAALIGAALDAGEVLVERDGLARRTPTRFTCLLLDEGIGDETAPTALAERLAFKLDLDFVPPSFGDEDMTSARDRLAAVTVPDDVVEALCAAGMAFGVPSLRVATLALRAAKAAAALAGRDTVAEDDATLAAALVIAPRATTVPAADLDDGRENEKSEEPDDGLQDNAPPDQRSDAAETSDPSDTGPGASDKSLQDLVLDATRAAIPAGLLAAMSLAAGLARASSAPGRAGASRASAKRGRPIGVRRGLPGHGGRLALVDTLRAAAPWQAIRRKSAPAATSATRILVRQEDFRLARFKQKSETVTIFVVDASGSAALHRLAEVKGAVELILAECYVRRDSVALIAFRGDGAETVLPPTRSLARAKRALAGQAGGGGTPLARAIEASGLLADGVRRKGQAPLVVFLTDGKANIGRSGQRGRAEAEADALLAARAFRLGGWPSLLLDTAPRPTEAAGRMAVAMGARYLALPYADAGALSQIVIGATMSRSARNI